MHIELGLGLVVEDKKPGDVVLWCQPTDILTDISGDLTTFKDKVGDIDVTNKIPAIWMGYDDARETAPDMVVGERVMLFQMHGTDTWMWASIGKSNDLRKLEHVVFNFSNTKGVNEKPTPQNQLFISISTRDGCLKIITPKNREEKALYTVNMDFKNGLVTMNDDNNNSWSWDTIRRHVEMTTKTMKYNVEDTTITGNVTIQGTLTVYLTTLLKSRLITKASASIKGALTAASGAFKGSCKAAKGKFKGGPFT